MDEQANMPVKPADDAEEDISMEEMYRIMREVACGSEPFRPDSPAAAAFRAEVERDAEQMKANGQQMAVPYDWV